MRTFPGESLNDITILKFPSNRHIYQHVIEIFSWFPEYQLFFFEKDTPVEISTIFF